MVVTGAEAAKATAAKIPPCRLLATSWPYRRRSLWWQNVAASAEIDPPDSDRWLLIVRATSQRSLLTVNLDLAPAAHSNHLGPLPSPSEGLTLPTHHRCTQTREDTADNTGTDSTSMMVAGSEDGSTDAGTLTNTWSSEVLLLGVLSTEAFRRLSHRSVGEHSSRSFVLSPLSRFLTSGPRRSVVRPPYAI